jgi:flagellin
MSFSIQTNVNAIQAQENLRVNSNFQSRTIQRLTSGYRINQSAEDAAGLAIANRFRSETSELSQGVLNANNGVSNLQIVDSGMSNISQLLARAKTLVDQSASENFEGDRTKLNDEFKNLTTEINRQAKAIGMDIGGHNAKDLQVFLGGNGGSGQPLSVDLTKSTVDAQSLGLTKTVDGKTVATDISSAEGAKQAVDALSKAMTTLGTAQSTVGKGENMLAYAVNLAQSQLTNVAAAESRIRDADLAVEVAGLSKAQVLQQSSTAALAQANSAPQAVLALLRG